MKEGRALINGKLRRFETLYCTESLLLLFERHGK